MSEQSSPCVGADWYNIGRVNHRDVVDEMRFFKVSVMLCLLGCLVKFSIRLLSISIEEVYCVQLLRVQSLRSQQLARDGIFVRRKG